MKEKLQSILDNIAPGASLDDVLPQENLREALDIDSFDFLRLVQGIEEQLGLTIPEPDYPRLDTLDGMLEYLASRRA